MVTWYLLLVQVDDEVLLGLELPGELRSSHGGQGSLFRLGDRVAFHSWLICNYSSKIRQNHVISYDNPKNCGTVRNGVSF